MCSDSNLYYFLISEDEKQLNVNENKQYKIVSNNSASFFMKTVSGKYI